MRLIMLFLILLFFCPAFAQGNVQENNGSEKTTFSDTHHQKRIYLSVFLNENQEDETKVADKTPVPTAELIDFTFLTTVLTQYHSFLNGGVSIVLLTHEPLFKLNCIFLI